MSRKYLVVLLAAIFVLGAIGSSFAVSSYVNSFSSTYPTSGSASFGCSLCHTSAPTRNAYGAAWANANHNFRTIESQDSDGDTFSNIAEINAGTNPGSSASRPAAPPPPAACTSFTYSAWSACQSNGTQSRTVVSSLPAGCTGGTPVLTQACTYVPPVTACTSFTYSAWGACQSNNTQSRTVVSSLPAGCTGGNPVLNQACTYVPPVNACTSFTFSAWGACQSDNTQSRTVVSSQPAGCTGTPPASQLTQICNYVPPVTPPPAGQPMPSPKDDDVFRYKPVASPVVSSDPAKAKPVGLGNVVTGGNTMSIKVKVGPFAQPLDVALVFYAPAFDSEDLYFIGPDKEAVKLSDMVREDERASLRDGERSAGSRDGDGGDGDSRRSRKSRKLVFWKEGVTQIDETIFTGPVSDLEPGLYSFSLIATSPDDEDNYYRWVTHITIP